MVLKIFEISMSGEIKGTLTAEQVVRAAVQGRFILIFEEKECSFVMRPELKIFSSKGPEFCTLRNMIKGVVGEIFHAHLAPRKKTESTGITPGILVGKENCSRYPGWDFFELVAV